MMQGCHTPLPPKKIETPSRVSPFWFETELKQCKGTPLHKGFYFSKIKGPIAIVSIIWVAQKLTQLK